MRQTAVEWVFQELDNYYQMKSKFKSKKEILEQAKEMEKQQQGYSEEDMKQSFHVGRLYLGREGDTNFEKFIEQFKNK